MPLSQLDKQPVLIVIDLQKGNVSLPMARPTKEITDRSASLARAFRHRGFPVVLVNVAGGAPGRTDTMGNFDPPADWAELVEELSQHTNDHVITKPRWGAFYDSGLEQLLKRLCVTQVFLCGIATSIGAESTARQAHEHSYHVVLVEDAMTDPASEAHHHSVRNIFPRLGEVTDTAAVLAALNAG
ncbi:isochorismatase family protein [Bradyrhizobium sp. LMTR 3]|uniref:isochorismatase family protein n=1 Tax=Bradyrhizobium sp. LMTR 3 TaxID=189873 RepID=UPI0008107F28|nr:isochorismatase family protein [Bradyrhizobium sp. LMTR 3]OCK58379.1 hydrolase [Bradyrhizobium sp. LMTR 3]